MKLNFTKRLARRPFGIAVFLLSLILLMMGAGCTTDEAVGTVPPDFQLVAEVDLSTQSHVKESLGEFTLAETAVTSIFYTIPNIDTATFDLSLSGPNDASFVILHSEDFRTDENGGGTWEQSLPAGDYQLLLTVPQTSGTLSVYWHHK